MSLSVKKKLLIEYVNVEVEASLCGITVEKCDEVRLSFLGILTESGGNDREGV